MRDKQVEHRLYVKEEDMSDTMIKLTCRQCSKTFDRRLTEYRRSQKAGWDVFCNSSCAATYNNQQRGHKTTLCLYCGRETTNPKYCNSICSGAGKREARWREFDKQETFASSAIGSVKPYLIDRRGHKCEICGLGKWQQLSIALILDHIDGNSDNNDRDNLRLVCPNCDAQSPTYKGKNKGKGRHYRRQRYQDGKSY